MSSDQPAIAPQAASGERDFVHRLERDGLVVLADRPFEVRAEEAPLLAPRTSFGDAKSASFNPATGEARGVGGHSEAAALMARYAAWSTALVATLAPAYATTIEVGRTSFRWRDAADPPVSPRKDDRRLHADAFASQPTAGRRILRMFSNINPFGEARAWQIGEPFEDYARRWLEEVRRPLPGEAWLLCRLGVTRARRTPYDFLMLGLHDRAKLDAAYQASAPRRAADFAPGSTWIVFTDSVVHAAIGGRCALEQTFYLPVSAMAEPALSPLRILERLTGRALA